MAITAIIRSHMMIVGIIQCPLTAMALASTDVELHPQIRRLEQQI
jgi:hypothetical protein